MVTQYSIYHNSFPIDFYDLRTAVNASGGSLVLVKRVVLQSPEQRRLPDAQLPQ